MTQATSCPDVVVWVTMGITPHSTATRKSGRAGAALPSALPPLPPPASSSCCIRAAQPSNVCCIPMYIPACSRPVPASRSPVASTPVASTAPPNHASNAARTAASLAASSDATATAVDALAGQARTSVKDSSGDTELAPRSACCSGCSSACSSSEEEPPSDRRSHRGTEAPSASTLLRCAAADGPRACWHWYTTPSSRLVQPASRELVSDITSKLDKATRLCIISGMAASISRSTELAMEVAAVDGLLARRFWT
eukprot:scaffold75295_cov65-Phaeocystis_antarctica.AAC.2